jgi:hypothetical protein
MALNKSSDLSEEQEIEKMPSGITSPLSTLKRSHLCLLQWRDAAANDGLALEAALEEEVGKAGAEGVAQSLMFRGIGSRELRA